MEAIESVQAPAQQHGPLPMDIPVKVGLAQLAHGISPASVTMAFADWLTHLVVSPSKQSELAASALRKDLMWQQFASSVWHGHCEPCIEPAPHDKRFAPPEWQGPPFNVMAQAFLLQQQWWREATTGVRGVSKHHQDVVDFTVRQILDMWSPSNFVASNPQVLKQTAATLGTNLATGYANWLRDAIAVMAHGKARGVEKFLPGKAVALTPGKVVYRNHLIELIQYEPAGARVHAQPVLIVPSWIMKYYILDLTPADSLVKYLVGHGHTVFMVSWKNPGAEDHDLGMDDYLNLGVLSAIKEVHERYPKPGIHAMGYCLGGTLLSIGAALLGARPGNPLRTVSLLAAETDFHEPGELGLFIDESQISFLEDLMAEHGYLDGRQMAGAFQLINSKDLVWSKLVHEYLMGAQSPMTALHAWNADATRLPARMHSEYLRGLYLHNDLAEDRYRANGKTVSLRDIKVPMFVVATERDHVSPWKSVYKINYMVGGPVSFLLTSGGHNVGIVNPPGAAAVRNKASYRFATRTAAKSPTDADTWQHHAPSYPGSWWPRWQEWLASHSAGHVAAQPVKGLIEDGSPVLAPGTYVHQG